MGQGKTAETGHKASIRQENKRKILVAAEKVFAEKGFKGASVKLIAEQAGLPKPNVYYYFGTKTDLYRVVIEEVCETWLHSADRFAVGEDPKDVISSYVLSKMDLARDRPYGSRLWAIEMASGAPFLQEYLNATVKPWLESREDIMNQWIADGKLAPCDPRSIFFMIWGTTQHYADFEAQIIAMNQGQPLSDAQFDTAKENVNTMILRSLKLA